MHMRRFLSPRWLGLHAAMVVIVAGFLALGWWQLRRAVGGNALSWGYTFEWPLFAGFVVVFWVKAMRDELREDQAHHRDSPVALPAGIKAGGARQGPAAGYRGAGGAPSPEPGGGPQLAAGEGDAEEDAELAAYNAYLRRLNAEATRSAGRVATRGSRRRASAWPARPGRDAGGGGAAQGGDRPHMEV